MAKRKNKTCGRHGCFIAIPANEKYCEKHMKKYLKKQLEYWNKKVEEEPKKRQYNKNRDQKRANSNKRGYNYKWHKARCQFLLDNPLCVLCKEEGIIKAAYCVDHIIPHRGNQELFWNIDNWQSLCQSCHSKKTLHEGNIND